MPKAADRSSKISNEESLRSSTTESKAVSVECPLLKPDRFLSRRLFCEREKQRLGLTQLVQGFLQ